MSEIADQQHTHSVRRSEPECLGFGDCLLLCHSSVPFWKVVSDNQNYCCCHSTGTYFAVEIVASLYPKQLLGKHNSLAFLLPRCFKTEQWLASVGLWTLQFRRWCEQALAQFNGERRMSTSFKRLKLLGCLLPMLVSGLRPRMRLSIERKDVLS